MHIPSSPCLEGFGGSFAGLMARLLAVLEVDSELATSNWRLFISFIVLTAASLCPDAREKAISGCAWGVLGLQNVLGAECWGA